MSREAPMELEFIKFPAPATILGCLYDLHRYKWANNSVFPLIFLMTESLKMTQFKAETCCSIRQIGSIV